MAHFQEKLFEEYEQAEEDYETHLATYVEELSAKRYDTALESCDGMLEASPKDAEAALCRALVHALRGDSEEEDDDYCTLWLKRCDRWRVDGEDCMGVPWGERAQRDFPPAKLRESGRPGRRRSWILTSPPTAATPRWRGASWRGARGGAGCGTTGAPQMPVVEITVESTAAQTVLDHVVDHGELLKKWWIIDRS